MVQNFIIEFDNHRKILTLSRQSLHKCIHTMAPASFTQNENIKRTRFPHLCFASPTISSFSRFMIAKKERTL